jgi:hypothetical protein
VPLLPAVWTLSPLPQAASVSVSAMAAGSTVRQDDGVMGVPPVERLDGSCHAATSAKDNERQGECQPYK